MLTAKTPETERKRLDDLYELKLLDTPPEPEFDDIVNLASELLETPVALICLVDKDRLSFKAKKGIEQIDIAREKTFCAHAILQDGIFEIPDARKDERFVDNPLVVNEPNIIFYAAYPLKSHSGQKIGTLCVIDHQPRKLSNHQKEQLSALGRQVDHLIEARRCQSERRDLQRKLDSEEKLANLGRIAAGVTHEINNPLTIIQGHLDKLRDSSDQPEKVEKIARATDRITRIVRETRKLFQFLRKPTQERVSLNESIQNALSSFQETIDELEVDIKNEVGFSDYVFFNPIQLDQVFSNIVENAMDALSHESTKILRIRTKEEGDRLFLTFEDSDAGIPDDLESKVMEPFFTTKEPNKGAGLGLSVAYHLVQANGGDMKIGDSELGGSKN